MFSQGDLVHVPENVIVYSYGADRQMIWPTDTSKEPHLAIFLEYCDVKYASVVTEDGKKWIVERSDIFFQEACDAC